MSPLSEIPVTFECEAEQLIGIIHPATDSLMQLGVLIIVGGPQYRVGSHRQFVLLARQLTANGFSTMRFDYRGMGDSTGETRSFEQIDADIRSALTCFYQHCPHLSGVVLWGLCDAASAALFYGYQDERIKGLALLNPWVFTEQGKAKTYLKHYYWQQLLNKTVWHKMFTRRFNYQDSFASLLAIVTALWHRQLPEQWQPSLPLPLRLRDCWQRFEQPILLILSGRDLTASEFKEMVNADCVWQQLLAEQRVTRHDLLAADHTFSSQAWRDQVADWVLHWLKNLSP